MDAKMKIGLSTCTGCLATNRKLKPLGKFLKLYSKLSRNFSQLKSGRLYSQETLVCWECHCQLYKINRFQLRIRRAQDVLLSNMQTQGGYASLSSLVVTTKNNYDYKMNYDRLSDITIKVEVSPLEYIKTDNEDNKFHYFMECEPEVSNDVLNQIKSDNYHENKLEASFGYNKIENYLKHEKKHIKEEAELIVESQNKKFKASKTAPSEHMQKIKRSTQKKCKVLFVNEQFSKKDECYKLVDIGAEEVNYWFDHEKKSTRYLLNRFQCDKCCTSYRNEKAFAQHEQKAHKVSPTSLVCGLCSVTFKKKKILANHINNHYKKFVCLLCQFECYKRWQIYMHFSYRHTKLIECLKCGLRFEKKTEFDFHYKSIHTKFICDYCGKCTYKKYVIEKHIKMKHTPIICQYCGSTFRNNDHRNRHIRKKHVIEPTEDTYCVECDLQFNNEYTYREHLKTSRKHVQKGIRFPCPRCEKVYARRWSLKNHISYFHEKKSKYYCDKCDRYFLHRYRLHEHIASVHDKILPMKNKLCPHCGRGFKDNRVLTNHIRTHTGERPYACEYCSACFAQKSALSTHVKAIHLKIKRK